MNRPNPGQPPAVPSVPPAHEGWITQERSYELITPLFGGGVEPGVADPVTAVRGTEVRGQLRFWWRACRGARYGGDLGRMKDAEDLLWGAASTKQNPHPSRVQIAVEVTSPGRDEHPFEVTAGKPGPTGSRPRGKTEAREKVAPAYAAFPLQPSEQEVRNGSPGMPTKALRVGVKFKLTVTYRQEDEADVAAASWAWETFGGVGGRTRRGFGSLRRTDDKMAGPPTAQGAAAWLKEQLAVHVLDGKAEDWPPNLPHLARKGVKGGTPFSPGERIADNIVPKGVRYLVLEPLPNAQDAWRYLITKLKDFRQHRPGGSYEPSNWPEPDAIRRLMGERSRSRVLSEATPKKFPRAVFGLPIIFHFKDTSLGDPGDTSLQGSQSERLSSPLILRPLVCGDGRAVGLVALLRAPRLPEGGLILKGAPGTPAVDADLTQDEADKITPLNRQPDVLAAFLSTLGKEIKN